MGKNKGIKKFVAGLAIGAGLGVLFAPKKGSETRKELKNKIDELVEKAREIDVKEVKDEIFEKISSIKAELEDLDKEKALNVAKKMASSIQKKATDLAGYAKEKATPVISNAADAVRAYAIDVTKEILSKLEQED